MTFRTEREKERGQVAGEFIIPPTHLSSSDSILAQGAFVVPPLYLSPAYWLLLAANKSHWPPLIQ